MFKLYSRTKCLLSILILFIFVQSINLVNAEESFNSIVENSPYPEFIYIDKNILPEVVKTSGVHVPSFLFFFVDGVYINLENPEEKAIKTPMWYLLKIVKSLNLLDELEYINPENGFVFINSRYVGKPVYYTSMEVPPGDILVYSKDLVKSIRFEGENTAYVNIVIKKEELPDTLRDEHMLKRMIENKIENIKDVKVREFNVQIQGDLILINMEMEANILDIDKLTSIGNIH